MSYTMPRPSAGSQLLKYLLIIAALTYGVKNREKIFHGVSDFFAKNQLVQDTAEGGKMLWDMMRPKTEAEKAQIEAFHKNRAKIEKSYRSDGVETRTKYVTPGDPEWKETLDFTQKLKRGERVD